MSIKQWVLDLCPIDWQLLSTNRAAVPFLRANPDKMYLPGLANNSEGYVLIEDKDELSYWWSNVAFSPDVEKILTHLSSNKPCSTIAWASSNPAMIPYFTEHPDEITGSIMSANPAACDLLRLYPQHIDWNIASKNPGLVPLLQENPDKINWRNLSENSAAMPLIEQWFAAHPDPQWIEFQCVTPMPGNNYNDVFCLDDIDTIPADLVQKIIFGCLFWIGDELRGVDPALIETIRVKLNQSISWAGLSKNEAAIQLLAQNLAKINWHFLSGNASAIDLLEANPDKVDPLQIWTNRGIFTTDTLNTPEPEQTPDTAAEQTPDTSETLP